MKRWLHLIHRWLGIALALLVLAWLVSGVVLLYVPRPSLTLAERLQAQAPLPPTQGLLSAQQAAQQAGLTGQAQAARLLMQGPHASWLLQSRESPGRWVAVDAQSGQRHAALSQAEALQRALGRTPGAQPRAALIERDQWTIYGRFKPHSPFWHVQLDDALGTEFYLSQASGEWVQDSTRWERGWNWLGSVTHWLYFTPLRADNALWRQVVLWTSGAALGLALLGLVLGWQRWRWRGYASGSRSPYREPWQRQHHLWGLGAGLVLAAWIFSGWLSMHPWGWNDAASKTRPAQPWAATAGWPSTVPALPTAMAWRELEWRSVNGQTYWLAHTWAQGQRHALLLDAQGQPLPEGLPAAVMQAALQAMYPGVAQEARWLREYDFHYYALRHSQAQGNRPLPVLRVALADAAATVYYLDPQGARVALRSDSSDRADRWLFSALHRWDWPPLHSWPLARDVVVIGWTLAATVLTLAGCVLAWRRLRQRITIRSKKGRSP
ncbi:PepSY domain-containing protein [Roseateles sp. BYS180W]|uniref:PepSY domain-containing protein n=1 Tax=Roseateles rivi TaxID=3299028 RepID=A0ABW7FSQ1_9BURK